MQIVAFNPATHTEIWKRYVDNNVNSTIYHTREWADVISSVFGFEEKSILAINDGSLCGLLPLWKVKKNKLVSSPWRDRADLLADNNGTVDLLLKHISSYFEDIYIRDFKSETIPDGFRICEYWLCHVLNLTEGYDKIWTEVNRSLGRNIRKAEKAGVRITTDGGFQEFYRLFCLTRKKLGVPIYGYNLFQTISEKLDKKQFKLYTAYFNDVPIASSLFFYHKKACIYAYGASHTDYLWTRANDLLMWNAVKDALDAGCCTFDFGADSPTQKSLFQFKRKWGAFPKKMSTLYKSDTSIDFADTDFSSEKYGMHRMILSHMPIGILRTLGTFLTKRDG